MNFDILADYALNFYSSYPFVVVAISIVLLFMAYKKPKESFKFAIFLLFMAAVFYALGLLGDTLSTGTQSANEGLINPGVWMINREGSGGHNTNFRK